MLAPEMLEALRPAPREALAPFQLTRVIGRKLTRDLQSGEHLTWGVLSDAGAT